jgi:hypothetical protein
VWKSITVKNAKVGFRLYNDANRQIPGSVTIIDSVFSGTESFAIEMAVPADVVDSGFTGLVLDNVRLDRPIKDHWSDNLILSSGYYKSVCCYPKLPPFRSQSLLIQQTVCDRSIQSHIRTCH